MQLKFIKDKNVLSLQNISSKTELTFFKTVRKKT